MAVMQAITRADTRQAAGEELGVVYIGLTTSGVDTSSVVDTNIIGGTNDHVGKWIRLTSGSYSGETQRVTAFNGAGDLSTNAFSGTVASGVTFFGNQLVSDISRFMLSRSGGSIFGECERTLHSCRRAQAKWQHESTGRKIHPQRPAFVPKRSCTQQFSGTRGRQSCA